MPLFERFDALWDQQKFPPLERLAVDIKTATKLPNVLIVEPSYESSPHLGSDQPNDNHAPLPMAFGEAFLRRVYRAVTSNPNRWKKTVIIVTYDEHGGFYDHAPPPNIAYTPANKAFPPFETLGVRVPTLIVSPLVDESSVNHLLFDHTSVLQFIAECFADEQQAAEVDGRLEYSKPVTERRNNGIETINSVGDVLREDGPRRGEIPVAPTPPVIAQAFSGPSPTVREPMEEVWVQAIQYCWGDPESRKRIRRHCPALYEWMVTGQP